MVLLWGTIAATLLYFFGFHDWRNRTCAAGHFSILESLYYSWNAEYPHWKSWWITVVTIAVCLIAGVRRWKSEPVTSGRWGLVWLGIGFLFWLEAPRSNMAWFAYFSLPLLVLGSIHFAVGWKRARHLALPLSLTLFLVPLPWAAYLTDQLYQPAFSLARRLFVIGGGQPDDFQPYGSWGRRLLNFQLLIPVILAAIVMARYECRARANRVLVLALALPVAFMIEALRIAVTVWMAWMNIDWLHDSFTKSYFEFFLVVLSAAFFILANWLLNKLLQGKGTRAGPESLPGP